MYEKHFNLSERPFSITPDPRFLYMSERHREALAHLLFGVGEGGGFVQLTGEVGTGKTTVCRCLLEQLPDHVDVALILNPKVTAVELIATICDELHTAYPPDCTSIKELTDVLNAYLLDAHAKGRCTVLIIDEAQNLDAEVLEQVRLLTNLETPTRKLLQIILIGQPELRDLLARNEMRQLAQRVTARYHLEPLLMAETSAYIHHRLQVCGATRPVFTSSAVETVHRLAGGVPRLINVLCDRAMLGAYVDGRSRVDRKIVRKASIEVLPEVTVERHWRAWLPLAAASLAAIVVVSAWIYVPWESRASRLSENMPDSSGHSVVAGITSQDHAVPETREETEVRVPELTADIEADDETSVIDQAVPEALSLASLLDTADETYSHQAWGGLMDLWSVEPPVTADVDYCQWVQPHGLHCLQQKGSWNVLRRFDRPALLQLIASDGRKVTALLQGMDNTHAELVIGSGVYRFSVQQVERYWYGEYTLLWRATPDGRLVLRQGDRSKDVYWLRIQMEEIAGMEIPAEDPFYFDESLYENVLEFQRSQALSSDGVVGKLTLIQINTLSGRTGIPRLSDQS